jgi:hypothetical protein
MPPFYLLGAEQHRGQRYEGPLEGVRGCPPGAMSRTHSVHDIPQTPPLPTEEWVHGWPFTHVCTAEVGAASQVTYREGTRSSRGSSTTAAAAARQSKDFQKFQI